MAPLARLPITDWSIEHFRTTVFRNGGSPKAGVWQRLAGDEPSQVATQPKAHIQREEGPYHDGVLAIEQRFDRADLVFSGKLPESPGTLVSIGTFSSAMEVFSVLTKDFLKEVDTGIRRIALGLVALYQVAGHDLGYNQMSSYVPFDLDPKDREFSYQINKVRHSTVVPDLLLNRLRKWSVAKFQVTTVAIGPGGALPVLSGDPTYACRVEMDLNTDGEYAKELEPQSVPLLFDELVACAREIFEKGDRG